MGLRAKMLGLFLISFGLMSFIALALLHSNLQQGFLSLEHKQAIDQMAQLSRNLNGEMERLSQMTFDWANWDEAYSFMQHPNKNFTDRHVVPSALKEIDIKLFVILDNEGNTVFSEAVNLMTGDAESAASFDNTLNNIKKRIAEPRPGSNNVCGMDISTAGPILVCWQPIRRSDLSGKPVGIIVMGRLINSTLISKIQIQSNIKFELTQLPLHDIEPGATAINTIEPQQVEFSTTEPDVLNALLFNFNGQPILKVRLNYPGDISNRGTAMTWKVVEVFTVVTAITAVMLFFGMQFLFVRRLQKMGNDLNSIWRNGRWAERLASTNGSDELNELAQAINRMLGLIRKQVMVLETIAHSDTLTKIANRRAFDQRVLIEMSLHKRNHTPLTALLISVDHFTEYNDHYGHPAGDEVLIEISKLLTLVACRPSDLPARISEEEFAVILPCTDLSGAQHVAEALRSKLHALNLVNVNSPISDRITVSIGISSAGDENLDTFMQRVIDANYQAKQTGKNKVSYLP